MCRNICRAGYAGRIHIIARGVGSLAVDRERIDKLLEQVQDYTIEYYSDGEVIAVEAKVGRGDDRAYVKFDNAFMKAHRDRQYPTADKMCLRSKMTGEMVCFAIKYEEVR